MRAAGTAPGFELTDSQKAELRTAVSAVLYGAVWDGFNGLVDSADDDDESK